MAPLVEQEVTEVDRRSMKRLSLDLAAGMIVACGFILRLKLASATFLNADEALHFMAANQPSWKLTYQASLTISHPPLLIFLLHLWRYLGTSEVILRLPSVLAGTVFCWVFFKWLENLFGREVGVVGVIFAAFLPPLIALSTEVRQYSLLLMFVVCSMYFLERALAEDSAQEMLLSSICLWLALLCQYSAVLVAGSLGIYALIRMLRQRPGITVVGTWFSGQIVAVAICLVLYRTYISAFGSRAMHSWMDVYLHNSYFDGSRHNALLFVVARTASVFQYIFGQNAVGDVMFLIFLAGIVSVLKSGRQSNSTPVSRADIATLLVLPFAINCALSLVDLYPYGGTRHCVFLTIFAIAGISCAICTFTRRQLWRGVAAVAVIIVVCHVSPSRRLPYMAPADQQKKHMNQALDFLREHVGANELLFVDNQTSLLLAHYLCQQRPFFINEWAKGFNTLQCGGQHIVGTDGRVFTFTAANFFSTWNEMLNAYALTPGDSVWIVQMGWRWEDPLASELKERYSDFRDVQIHSFGHNIYIFQFPVSRGISPGR